VPAITTTIDRNQRDGLYEVICNHLSQIQDFWVAMQRTKDGATDARRRALAAPPGASLPGPWFSP
jgi:hypothetical protein